MKEGKLRIDRCLWTLRIYRTRSLASDACKRNWVKVNDCVAKPSKLVNINDIVSARTSTVRKCFRIIKLTERRVSAKEVIEYLEDMTPREKNDEMLQSVQKTIKKLNTCSRGRPSKKQRRDLEEFLYGGSD